MHTFSWSRGRPSFHQVTGLDSVWHVNEAGDPSGSVWLAGPNSMTAGAGRDAVTISSRVRATSPPASLTAPHHTAPESSRRNCRMDSVPLASTCHLESLLFVLIEFKIKLVFLKIGQESLLVGRHCCA